MVYNHSLEFEKDYQELEKKLKELKELAQKRNMDLSEEFSVLEEKLALNKETRYQTLTAWQKVQLARHPERPTTLDYIQALFDDFIELHGDRFYKDDPAIVGGIACFKGIPVTVLGHQKGKDTNQNLKRNFGMPHPEGYRKAYRLMTQAEKFKRPVVCFIDTQGAYPGVEAEERGQGWAISRLLYQMSFLKTPVISLVIGEGGSGGALALGVADRILMLSYAIYSVISPEGCASILHKDITRAHEMAEALKITAANLQEIGIVDEVIPEPIEGAHSNPEQIYKVVGERLQTHLNELLSQNPEDLVEQRYKRLRKIGIYSE